MTDIDRNITIDITGNTADMATDYNTSGIGLTQAHVAISKLVWGDHTEGKRITLSDPLPIQFAGQTGPLTVGGTIAGTTGGSFSIRNYGQDGSGASADLHYLAIAGNTSGTLSVGVTGTMEGIVGGTPIAVTGDARISGAMADDRQDIGGLLMQGTSAGSTASVAGEVFPGYGFGVPIAVTGGRRLNSDIDSVNVSGTVNSTGGRQMSPSSDAVAVYGWDQGKSVHTMLRASNDGVTAGFSGDALKVAVTNGNFTINATVNAVLGVTNASEPPLRIQGYTASAQADPVVVRGENNGALEITATSALSTSVSNIVTINDDDIIAYLGGPEVNGIDSPIVNKLTDIESGTNNLSGIRSDLSSGNVKATISSIERPSNLRSGHKSVTSTPTILNTNLQMKSGVTIKASPLNNDNILVGNQGLTTNAKNGYLLEPGESIFIEINNLNKIYVKIAGTSNSNGTNAVYYIGT
jgi:hypothetical protein